MTQTTYWLGESTASFGKTRPIAGNGRVRSAKAEASESYFFCEVGGNLYAIMLFPLGDQFVRITLLLGPMLLVSAGAHH